MSSTRVSSTPAPATCRHAPPPLSLRSFVNTVPISADRSVNRFALVRSLTGPWDATGLVAGVFNADAWDEAARR